MIKPSTSAGHHVFLYRRIGERACIQILGQQRVHPVSDFFDLDIVLTILIDQILVFGPEPQMIDAIGNLIDARIAEEIEHIAIALNEMKAGFDALFIIAVVLDPIGPFVARDPIGEHVDVSGAKRPVICDPCGLDSFDNDGIHGSPCRCTRFYLVMVDMQVQTRINDRDLDQSVQSGVGFGECKACRIKGRICVERRIEIFRGHGSIRLVGTRSRVLFLCRCIKRGGPALAGFLLWGGRSVRAKVGRKVTRNS